MTDHSLKEQVMGGTRSEDSERLVSAICFQCRTVSWL